MQPLCWYDCKIDVTTMENSVVFRKKKFKIDPEISFLDIYPKKIEARSQRDICTPMLIAALLTIAKRWKLKMVKTVNCMLCLFTTV